MVAQSVKAMSCTVVSGSWILISYWFYQYLLSFVTIFTNTMKIVKTVLVFLLQGYQYCKVFHTTSENEAKSQGLKSTYTEAISPSSRDLRVRRVCNSSILSSFNCSTSRTFLSLISAFSFSLKQYINKFLKENF